jgi:hypothetical protein
MAADGETLRLGRGIYQASHADMGMQHDLSARAADGASEGLNLDRRAAYGQAAHL